MRMKPCEWGEEEGPLIMRNHDHEWPFTRAGSRKGPHDRQGVCMYVRECVGEVWSSMSWVGLEVGEPGGHLPHTLYTATPVGEEALEN